MAQDLQELYNKTWERALGSGTADFGDVELSKKLFEKAEISKKSSVLEIGCGIGELCNELYRNGFKKITGIDISEVAIFYGRRKFPDINLRVGDGSSLDFPNESFDVCLSFDLLEHLPNAERHLKEVERVLRPSGKYIFQTPNIFSNPIIETLAVRGFSWRKFHPSLQTSLGLSRLLKKTGFRKVEFVKISPTSQKKLKSLPSFSVGIFNLIPWKVFPIFFAN